MNYNYENISKEVNTIFPLGVDEIRILEPGQIKYLEMGGKIIGKGKHAEKRFYLVVHTEKTYFTLWFENVAQAKEAVYIIEQRGDNRIVLIRAKFKDEDDSRLRRDYVTQFGSNIFDQTINLL